MDNIIDTLHTSAENLQDARETQNVYNNAGSYNKNFNKSRDDHTPVNDFNRKRKGDYSDKSDHGAKVARTNTYSNKDNYRAGNFSRKGNFFRKAAGSPKDFPAPRKKKCYRACSYWARKLRLLQNSFRSFETTRRSATDSQSETTKSISSASSFQNGNSPFNYESFKKGRPCSDFGFSRCIFAHSNSHRFLRLRFSRSQLPISSNAIRIKSAPRVFTNIMAVLAAYLRKLMIQIFIYLDDWLISNSDRTALENQMHFVLRLVQDLGLLVNQKKVKLNTNPTYRILGSHFQSRERDSNTNRDNISKYFGKKKAYY
ncbi:unnamed protein product [Mytilus coruscus]|uniref:Reverse transcriptase domain-containing protein n=1 Tax=Mytilus coruscus TaxID=42192 RepID=A0A6J8EKU1_MYTCO|nr:unnamed protein product [Mytilus coruscus]